MIITSTPSKAELSTIKNWTQIDVTVLTIEMYDWLKANIAIGEWAGGLCRPETNHDAVYFKDPKMATYFTLRWS